ncbi:MAG: MFS transporter [Propionibacterium sp.]|nr:MFS transporter [Propionibacterium sp.]
MSDTQTSTQTAIRLAPVVAIGLSFFVGNLDATVVNVATTQIGSDLNASTTELAWTVNGFVLAVAGLLLFAGDLAGRFGARRLYVWGLALFTVASIIAGAAPAAPVLIAARVLQGIGAALFQPAGLVLLGAAYPDTAVRSA